MKFSDACFDLFCLNLEGGVCSKFVVLTDIAQDKIFKIVPGWRMLEQTAKTCSSTSMLIRWCLLKPACCRIPGKSFQQDNFSLILAV